MLLSFLSSSFVAVAGSVQVGVEREVNVITKREECSLLSLSITMSICTDGAAGTVGNRIENGKHNMKGVFDLWFLCSSTGEQRENDGDGRRTSEGRVESNRIAIVDSVRRRRLVLVVFL